MSTVTQRPTDPQRSPLQDLRLTNWPLVQEVPFALSTVAVSIVLSVIAAFVSASAIMGLVAFMALAASVWRLWWPVTFELGHSGIIETSLGRRRSIPWRQVGRVEVRRHGILILSDVQSIPLAALRGIYLRWRDHRQQVLQLVETHVPADRIVQS